MRGGFVKLENENNRKTYIKCSLLVKVYFSSKTYESNINQNNIILSEICNFYTDTISNFELPLP